MTMLTLCLHCQIFFSVRYPELCSDRAAALAEVNQAHQRLKANNDDLEQRIDELNTALNERIGLIQATSMLACASDDGVDSPGSTKRPRLDAPDCPHEQAPLDGGSAQSPADKLSQVRRQLDTLTQSMRPTGAQDVNVDTMTTPLEQQRMRLLSELQATMDSARVPGSSSDAVGVDGAQADGSLARADIIRWALGSLLLDPKSIQEGDAPHASVKYVRSLIDRFIKEATDQRLPLSTDKAPANP
ncbi:uncharacterized protein BJ171DRAFT_515967 [Polychytrium aggregatum]|uniref:uncharacterized protein n=1 Tax=Polychytrium aggregatum TaxID=110093 RepID=UPI0022FEA3D0|nr:uncharacterized protein BJ171DRAFT_515967 [Polychytrium aggregatum]KAI9201931.1 hypothetical protein BJ171DRAFT_515967 [Polychytrium aggregatum]